MQPQAVHPERASAFPRASSRGSRAWMVLIRCLMSSDMSSTMPFVRGPMYGGAEVCARMAVRIAPVKRACRFYLANNRAYGRSLRPIPAANPCGQGDGAFALLCPAACDNVVAMEERP